MSKYIQYTADDEDPDCMMCINIDADDQFCKTFCGSEHSWGGYYRQEEVGEEGGAE